MMMFSIFIWSVWFVFEILLARFLKAKSTTSKEYDKNSLTVLWLTLIVSISLGSFLAPYSTFRISDTEFIVISGLILIISGIIFRVLAIHTLGKFFTVNVSLHDNHHLIDFGLYRIIRHPSYTGSLISFFGLGLSLNSWLSLAVIFIPIFLSFSYRIKVEEKLLVRQFGNRYLGYQKRTQRLIPFVY